MSALRADVGIDLGTASVLVYIKGKGIVLKEPSVVAIDQYTNKFLAVGEEARKMLGRTPGNIVAVRPLKDGVISDYSITERMLKYFIQKALGRMWLKPRIIICVPSGDAASMGSAAFFAPLILTFPFNGGLFSTMILSKISPPKSYALS